MKTQIVRMILIVWSLSQLLLLVSQCVGRNACKFARMNDKENMCCPGTGSSRMQIGEISTETVTILVDFGISFWLNPTNVSNLLWLMKEEVIKVKMSLIECSRCYSINPVLTDIVLQIQSVSSHQHLYKDLWLSLPGLDLLDHTEAWAEGTDDAVDDCIAHPVN